MTLRIGIDAHSIGSCAGGNETYITNLIEALAGIDSENEYTIYVTRASAFDQYLDRWPNFSVRRIWPSAAIIRIPISLPAVLLRRPVDLLHVQYTAPPIINCPVIATIHDLSFEHLPEVFSVWRRMQLRATVRRTAKRAAGIITVSAYSCNDIVSKYGIPKERITVTPAGAAPHFERVNSREEIARVRQRYKIKGEYILTLGSSSPRKNIVRLLSAFSHLKRDRPRDKLPFLVIAGNYRHSGDELRVISEWDFADNVIFTGYVPETDLPALYSGALFFVYPSLFEGFGLPVLEAMQCGTPVITGNGTSLPEVVDGAGLMVNPLDTGEIAQALCRLLNDKELRARLSMMGAKRARKFTWERTARITLEAYKRAAARECPQVN